ncbi:MAG TPA: 50S ribosomal protein L4, partial [Candidatus Parcubacteria bacterium]|nr:50S ribosomal protein L4 [Candidatus Parcubacteria bacterium]
MEAQIYNQDGKQVGTIKLPEKIFNVPLNADLVHQAVLIQQSNRRRNIAKTKDRGAVRGGGKKPWRQKGTGRARAGSNRSPIWRGGGVTFGPTTDKNFKKKLTKKMRRKALFMVLSEKLRQDLLLIVDDLKVNEAKTKLIKPLLDKLFLSKGSGLIALPEVKQKVILAARNIPKVSVAQAKDLNVLDILSYK